MSKSIRLSLGLGLALGIVAASALSLPAKAAGVLTNGLPPVAPGTSYFAPNGQFNASGQSLTTYSGQLGGYESLPVDTGLGAGVQPQQVSATPFQIGALASVIGGNAVTATAGAATLNAEYGVVTSEALVTAAGATYTLTLTDSMITAMSKVQVAAFLGAGTAGALQVMSVTPMAGSVVVVVKNVGSAALNAAIKVVFQAM